MFTPAMAELRQCRPAQTRALTISSSSCCTVSNSRVVVKVVPPAAAPQILALIICVPRAFTSTSAKADVTQPCADGYSGWFGVESNGDQAGSAVVAALPSRSAFLIAE